MGFFSDLFGSSQSDQERQIAEPYIQSLQYRGMSISEARKTVNEFIQQAKAEGQREGTANLPLNYGDLLLEHEASDNQIRTKLEIVRAEGATSEDVRKWWNLHDLERRLAIKDDDTTRTATFLQSLSEGLPPERAASHVRKYHPMYGDPNDTKHSTGDDRPLPYELKDRVNDYIWRRASTSPTDYKRDIEASSTFNALIRKEMRDGKA